MSSRRQRLGLAAVAALSGILLTASPGDARVIDGTDGSDVLIGTRHAERIHPRGGDDDVRARRGTDIVNGGAGDDLVRMGRGGSTVYPHGEFEYATGDGGDDRLFGDRGDDKLVGGRGRDLVFGGPGDDYLEDGSGRDAIRAGSGNDRALAFAGFVDTIRMGPGRDLVHLWQDGDADIVHCGRGHDTVAWMGDEDELDQLVGCETLGISLD